MNANNVWINQIPCATAITIKPTKTKRTNFIFQISRTLNDLVFSQSNEEHKFCCKLFIRHSAIKNWRFLYFHGRCVIDMSLFSEVYCDCSILNVYWLFSYNWRAVCHFTWCSYCKNIKGFRVFADSQSTLEITDFPQKK